MIKKLITLLFTVPLTVMANFLSSNDNTWNYHFAEYSNYGGILEANTTTPLFTPDASVLDSLLNSLPEGHRADVDHPEYFPAPEPEILVKETAEVFVTFYHEGAGYKNSLGYYLYDGDTNRSRPSTLQEIKDDGVIVFPNTSLLYSGGDMTLGTTVSLGTLNAGTRVMFFVISNGWKGASTGVRSSSDWIFSSISSLNLEYNPTSTKAVPDDKHVALLWNNVGPGNILLMGFEDILRTSSSCDHDYNDVLFSVSSSPMSALSDSIEVETGEKGFSLAPEETDTDADGVNDAYDVYPDDFQRAYVSFYPNKDANATLIFEDMWPREGDYDMNDLSIAFNIEEVKNASHEVKDIKFRGKVQSYGAGYTNGFAIMINTPIDNIISATITRNFIEDNILWNLQADGNSTIIRFFDDASDYLPHFANVYKNNAYEQSEVFEINLTLQKAANIVTPPYNPFLIVTRAVENNDGSYTVRDDIEVHLPNYMPTSYLPQELMGTLDDTSNLALGRTYLTHDNKPWGLLIPTNFAHPVEKINIKDAYIHYEDWVKNDGLSYKDWYIHTKRNNNNDLYADENKIIVHP